MWLVTFADLVALLLTFFVMLYAMSSVKVDQWQTLSGSLSRRLNPSDAPVTSAPTAQYNIASVFRKRAINLDYLYAVLEQTIAEDRAFDGALLVPLGDRLVLSLPGDLLFAPGSAAVDERARRALVAVGGLLSNLTNPVGVVGHTDRQPQEGPVFSSNWELSLARAAAVANALAAAGYAGEVVALGAADGRYDAASGSVARRVDIIIMADGG